MVDHILSLYFKGRVASIRCKNFDAECELADRMDAYTNDDAPMQSLLLQTLENAVRNAYAQGIRDAVEMQGFAEILYDWFVEQEQRAQDAPSLVDR